MEGGVMDYSEPKLKRVYKRKVIQDAGSVPVNTGRGKIVGSNSNRASTNGAEGAKPISKRSKKPVDAASGKAAQTNNASQNASVRKESANSDDSSPQVAQQTAAAVKGNQRNSQFNPKGLAIIDKLGKFAKNYLQNPSKPEEQKKKKKLIEESEWNALADRKRKYFTIAEQYPYLKFSEEALGNKMKNGNGSKDSQAIGVDETKEVISIEDDGRSRDEGNDKQIEQEGEEEEEVICVNEQQDSDDNPQSPSYSQVSDMDAEEQDEDNNESIHIDDSSNSNDNDNNNEDNH